MKSKIWMFFIKRVECIEKKKKGKTLALMIYRFGNISSSMDSAIRASEMSLNILQQIFHIHEYISGCHVNLLSSTQVTVVLNHTRTRQFQ